MIDRLHQNLNDWIENLKNKQTNLIWTYLFDDNYHDEHVLNEIPMKINSLTNKMIDYSNLLVKQLVQSQHNLGTL